METFTLKIRNCKKEDIEELISYLEKFRKKIIKT